MTQERLKFQSHSLTSFEAAYKIREAGAAARQRELVWAALSAAGSDGLTDEQIEEITRLKGSSARPRRLELLEAGRILAAGTRKTKAGRNAVVWMVREGSHGQSQVRQG